MDYLSKELALTYLADGPIKVVGSFLQLKLAFNSGAAFSFASNATIFLSSFAMVVAASIFYYGRKITSTRWAVALGLALGGIFGNLNKSEKGKSSIDFGSSNIMWKATLKSLDFLPLISADYAGGIIIYDWYSQTNNPKEQIKISVQFLNNELRADSIKITAHKKICESIDRCANSTLDQNFANSIKESIISSARTLKIEEAKKQKK